MNWFFLAPPPAQCKDLLFVGLFFKVIAHRVLVDVQHTGHITHSAAIEGQLIDFVAYARLVDPIAVLALEIAAT